MRMSQADVTWGFPNAATPEGSDVYYAARFAPPVHRDRLALAFAWGHELGHLINKASDPGVARLKLDWWREELARARRGQPRHPLARQLADWLMVWPSLTPWLDMLDGAEDRIRKRQPTTTDEFHLQCRRLGGSMGWLLAAVDDQPTPTQIALAQRLTAYRAAVLDVRDLARHTQRQFCPLPAQALDAVGLTRDQLPQAQSQPALAQCLDNLLGSCDQVLLDARQVRRSALSAVLPSARLGFQAALLHRKLAKARYPVYRDYVDLTPLRRLWAAWRLR